MIPVNPAPADEIRRHIEDFRNCFSRLPMACFAVGTDGHVYFANTPAAELLGYSVEELTTHSVFDLYADTPAGTLKASRLFTRFEHGKEIRHAELQMQRKDGTLVPVCLCAYPVLASDGSTVASQSFVTDLTDLTQRHEHRIQRLLMQSTDAVFVIDPDDERILAANRRACTMLGYEYDELLAGSVSAIHPEEMELVRRHIHNTLDWGSTWTDELICRTKSGDSVPSETSLFVVEFEGRTCVSAIVRDVSERKARERRIEHLLSEKTTMLREIHHRVKNNLAVISALLRLQDQAVDDETVRALLRRTRLRIESISMVHEHAYNLDEFSSVRLDIFIRDFAPAVRASFGAQGRGISLDFDLDRSHVSITQALPCALILNELITNSFQHAFRDTSRGTIRITLRHTLDNQLRLSVSDNGVGLAEAFTVTGSKSLGLQVVSSLVGQLDGSLSAGDSPQESGAAFTVTFPMDTTQ